MIGGALSLLQMPKDIFPAINIPVVGIIWTYTGMPAQEMERRITTVSERALTTSVNNIEHIESNSFNGIAVIKVYLQPQASVDAAIAETTAECQTILKTLPPGMTPPNILSYNAANVPVLQLSVGGAKFSEQELYDFATNFIRTQLATVQGSSIPLPYGGKTRAVSVDLEHYKDSYLAALEAGYVRIRPVLMTAIAMIIGMVPMALGLGDGANKMRRWAGP
jgi:multidrug efflux pump subunit AcrB